jgi:heme exporter protein A
VGDQALISATGLGIVRGERVLFQGIDLTGRAGDAIILRGANGSGKTTLLRLLAGLTRPEAGKVSRAAPHHWVSHREGLKPHETPATHLKVWARAWGSNAEIAPVLAEMGLSRPCDVPARHLSAGQRRRTALARLKLDPRPIWLLDEPFTALDNDGCKQILDLMSAHRAEGGLVIAAIHGQAGFSASQEVQL